MAQLTLGKGSIINALGNLSHQTLVLSGTLVASADWPVVSFLDPDGVERDVDMPPEEDVVGKLFLIGNVGSVSNVHLDIRNDVGGSICQVNRFEMAVLVTNGTLWTGGTLGFT